MSNRSLLILGLLAWAILTAQAQIPFDTTPSWISDDVAGYGTGAAWADINQDGWPDLVIANGNDMARQRVAVYYNSGTGSLPGTPDWESDDIDYHGHLSAGDVNNDGYIDVAVSVYIGAGGFGQKGTVKLYMNEKGTLSSLPVWIAGEPIYSFSCAFGDADGDGDLDLAVAGGESYYQHTEQNRVYFNTDGILEQVPSWRAGTAGYSYDVTWSDFDLDGDADLAFADEYGPNCFYENFGDSIGTSPIWRSEDAGRFANSLFAGDVNGDGYPDLAVSDNDQLGGSGHFKLYLNNGGMLDPMPFWSSSTSGYGSGITLADIDNDDDRDLVCGGWWEPCRIFLNESGTFASMPDWTSATGSVVEAMVFSDFDRDGLDTVTVEFIADSLAHLLMLPRSPLEQVIALLFGTDTVASDNYCYNLENGWISLGVLPAPGTTITAVAVLSGDLDLAVSNWDSDDGNYLFVNTSTPVSVTVDQSQPVGHQLFQNYPNPFNPATRLSYTLGSRQWVVLSIYDNLGRELVTLVNGIKDAGTYEVSWDAGAYTSGVYFCRFKTGGLVETRKMTLVR